MWYERRTPGVCTACGINIDDGERARDHKSAAVRCFIAMFCSVRSMLYMLVRESLFGSERARDARFVSKHIHVLLLGHFVLVAQVGLCCCCWCTMLQALSAVSDRHQPGHTAVE